MKELTRYNFEIGDLVLFRAKIKSNIPGKVIDKKNIYFDYLRHQILVGWKITKNGKLYIKTIWIKAIYLKPYVPQPSKFYLKLQWIKRKIQNLMNMFSQVR